MKTTLFATLMGMVMGAAIHARLTPDPKTEVVKEVQVKTKIVRVTEANGKVTETVITKSEEKTPPKIAPKYGVGIFHDKTMLAEARLGNLPLFVVATTDFKSDHKIGIKIEF